MAFHFEYTQGPRNHKPRPRINANRRASLRGVQPATAMRQGKVSPAANGTSVVSPNGTSCGI